MTKQPAVTIREAIRLYRGSFYKLLLDAHEAQDYLKLCLAYLKADAQHRAVMCEALPGIHEVAEVLVWRWPGSVTGCLERAFPGLKALDEQIDDPTEFDLLEEQPACEHVPGCTHIDGYRVDIRWSPEDDCYVATVPELPGCSAHGDTQAEAVQEAQTAIELWLETAKEMGREVPAPKHGAPLGEAGGSS